MGHISGLGLPSVLEYKNNLIGIEIGLNMGYTTRHLFDNLLRLTLHGVDPYTPYQDWDGMSLTDSERSYTYDVFLENTKPYQSKIIHHKMTSDDAVKEIADNSCDFIFIDGLHTYEQVLKDCRNYYSKIKSGGVFSGHDYNVIKDVNRAVNEFAESVNATISQTDNDVWYWFKP